MEIPARLRPQVERGITVLQNGGLVAYPTDTVYGLGASVACREAVERVFQAKARPRDMAMPLLVSRMSQIEELAARVPRIARHLIDAFMPGALTLVLPASDSAPAFLKTSEGTIALRIPGHPIPIALIEGSGHPIVGTSANLSGKPSPLTAEEVIDQLGDRVDLIVDGGRCPGRESTIVDVTGEKPAILREGAISREAIEAACHPGTEH